MKHAFVVNLKLNPKSYIIRKISSADKGDDVLFELFDRGIHTAVGTDDTRLTKRLRTNGIPFILPAVIILKLLDLTISEALEMLSKMGGDRKYKSSGRITKY